MNYRQALIMILLSGAFSALSSMDEYVHHSEAADAAHTTNLLCALIANRSCSENHLCDFIQKNVANASLDVNQSSSSRYGPPCQLPLCCSGGIRRQHTPLGLAIHYEYPQVLQLLIKLKANVNTASGAYLPLDLAVERVSYDGVNLLIGARADVNNSCLGTTSLGNALLELSCTDKQQRLTQMVYYLIQCGASPQYRKNSEDKRPIEYVGCIDKKKKIIGYYLALQRTRRALADSWQMWKNFVPEANKPTNAAKRRQRRKKRECYGRKRYKLYY